MEFYNGLLRQYDKLLTWLPLSSAFEHQAQPDIPKDPPFAHLWANASFHGNFTGWQQHRMLFVQPPLIRQNSLPQPQEHRING
jgi:hypothetical protein